MLFICILLVCVSDISLEMPCSWCTPSSSFRLLKSQPSKQKKKPTWLQILNKVVLKSSSLSLSTVKLCWLLLMFATPTWAQLLGCYRIWRLRTYSLATLFTFLPVCFSWCCCCGLGFLVCLVFIRFFRDWQGKMHLGIYSGCRLFPSVSYLG